MVPKLFSCVTRLIVADRPCSWTRSFSTFGIAQQSGKPPDWTIQEDKIISDFLAKGESVRAALPSLPGRVLGALRERATLLRLANGKPLPRHIPPTRWTSEEDEKLRGLMKDGLSLRQARQYFPHKGLHSVKDRWFTQLGPNVAKLSRANTGKHYTRQEVAAVLEMRRANNTVAQIAEKLGRSSPGIKQLVRTRELRREVKQQTAGSAWTPEEDGKLSKLYWATCQYLR